MDDKLKLHGVVIESQKGGYTGYFSEFPEAIAEGETEEEVRKNMFDALIEIISFKKGTDNESHKEGTTSFELNLEIA